MRVQQTPAETRINLTPMLDVVFIMLIFFIVTATFVKEQGLAINPPEPSTAPPPDTLANVLVRISAGNRILLADRAVDIRAVRANFERLQAQNPAAKVVIDAHPASSNATLVAVMDASRLAGIEGIQLVER